MSPLTPIFLALVCSIFVTTSEPADYGRNLNKSYEAETRINPKLTYLYNNHNNAMRHFNAKTRRKREIDDPRCASFNFQPGKTILTSPKNNQSDTTYSGDTTCMTTIEAEEGHVIVLTFIDVFAMEDRPPKCENDYLEIRDGKFGYAQPVYTFCGKNFPPTVTSSGPFMWLKFKSDDSIEYAGFKINIEYQARTFTRVIPLSCLIVPTVSFGAGEIGSNMEDVKKCREQTNGALDIQWKIETSPNTRIYLNFTEFVLAKPNECNHNMVQVFGAETNFDHNLGVFCGSVATLVTTKEGAGPSNIMFVRLFTTFRTSNFSAQFTSFRTLKGDEKCNLVTEVDCLDGTCIDGGLKCNKKTNCRLKADEDPELCKGKAESLMNDKDSRNILIVLCLILTGMSSVFIFKCARKLYLDQKQIKEHLAQSCEDRLDKLALSQLSLAPSMLVRDTEPRASLERENHTNLHKQQRNQRKSSSLDSDFEQDFDLSDWPESQLIPMGDSRHKGRLKRDLSKKEESLRSKEEGEDNRDVTVEVPAAMEAGCQTRDSLFQEPTLSANGTNSGSNGRGFSTFGFSGATIARPSPAPANTTQLTIELLRQVTPQDSVKSQPASRPMSSETTRSAPDVIIVAKPTG